MKRKILSIFIALCLVLALVPTNLISPRAEAAGTDVSRYFYNQLDSKAKMFYDGMVKMYNQGIFLDGKSSYEFTEADYPGLSDLLASHMNGSANLLYDYAAGRDAFYMDYPDVFYVDFSNLSIRITETSDHKYHLYMGAGRYDNYYTAGFSSKEQVLSAIDDYNAALDEAVAAANGMATPAEKVTAVHDYLTHHTTYRDEVALSKAGRPENVGFIRTAYGCLVKHEGVCESYTRAFKAAMDKLNIPCVMVFGVYRHSEDVLEEHIWDLVEIDGLWYGVDVTMDDPINPNKTNSDGVDGYENKENLLVGDFDLMEHHVPMGVMSESGFEFKYPVMSLENQGVVTISDENSPLRVRTGIGEFEGETAGFYYVSYLGMDMNEMKSEGYYLIMRNSVFDSVYGWQDTDWYYLATDGFDTSIFENKNHETIIKLPHVEYLELGVTDIAPIPAEPGKIPDYFFHGDPSLLLAKSGMLHNENGLYRAAPMPKTCTPTMSGRVTIGGSHHVTAVYDQIFITPSDYDKYFNPEKVGDVDVTNPGYVAALTGAKQSDLKMNVTITDHGLRASLDPRPGYFNNVYRNLKFSVDLESETTTVEFDFTPSVMWADDNVTYSFNLEGIVGAWSGKAPAPIKYTCSYPCAICAYRNVGFDYNCFGKPMLVADSDLSLEDFTAKNGSLDGLTFTENLKDRLMLVAQTETKRDADVLEGMVEDRGEKVLSSESYNINLTLCRLQLANLKDGMSIRITVGFPAGYGPEDEGVTFKAYHFSKDESGQIIGIDEIPCTVTKYGLLIECKSFSPFTIVAVDGEEELQEKKIELVSGVGGTISSDKASSGLITLKKGEKATVTVTAEQGYVIDSVIAPANNYSDDNSKTHTFEISFDDIELGADIVSASFISEAVTESQEGKTALPEVAAPEEFSVGAGQVSASKGGSLVLSVSEPNNAYAYQWYLKDGNGAGSDKLIGTGASLTVDDVTEEYSGTYYVVAVASASGETKSTKSSDTVTVTVSHTHTFGAQGYAVESAPDSGHYFICTECGEHSPVYNHLYDSDGVCGDCGHKSDAHEHKFGTAYYADGDNGHYQSCTHVLTSGKVCPERTATVPHTYDADGYCTVCGHYNFSQHTHVMGTELLYDGEEGHYTRCEVMNAETGERCTEKSALTPHDTNNADHKCACGYAEVNIEHTYGDYISAGELGHYRVCEVCGTHSAYEPHEYDDNGDCTVCKYHNDAAHKHFTDAEREYDEAGHFQSCEMTLSDGSKCGYKTDEAEHDYDASGKCVVCGYVNDAAHKHNTDGGYVSLGDRGHYQSCAHIKSDGTVCGEAGGDIEPHNFSGNTCVDCGYTRTTYQHVHSFEVAVGPHYHYYYCPECGESLGAKLHTFNAAGYCTDCGYYKAPEAAVTPDDTKEEDLPEVSVVTPTEPGDQDAQEETDEPEDITVDDQEDGKEEENPKTGLAFSLFGLAAGILAMASKKR